MKSYTLTEQELAEVMLAGGGAVFDALLESIAACLPNAPQLAVPGILVIQAVITDSRPSIINADTAAKIVAGMMAAREQETVKP